MDRLWVVQNHKQKQHSVVLLGTFDIDMIPEQKYILIIRYKHLISLTWFQLSSKQYTLIFFFHWPFLCWLSGVPYWGMCHMQISRRKIVARNRWVLFFNGGPCSSFLMSLFLFLYSLSFLLLLALLSLSLLLPKEECWCKMLLSWHSKIHKNQNKILLAFQGYDPFSVTMLCSFLMECVLTHHALREELRRR